MVSRQQFVDDYSTHKGVYAMSGANRFDCSSSIIDSVRRLWGSTVAAKLGTYTGTMCTVGTEISQSQLQIGDLIYCDWASNGKTSTWDHVCVYAGGGNVWNHGGVPPVGPVLYPMTRETGAAMRVMFRSLDSLVHFTSATQPTPRPQATPSQGSVTITATLNVRVQPNTTAALAKNATIPNGLLYAGQIVEYVGKVGGTTAGGHNGWYKSINGNYFHSAYTSQPFDVHPAAATAPAPQPAVPQTCTWKVVAKEGMNVRSAPHTTAGLAGSRFLSAGSTFVGYSTTVTGDNVDGVGQWVHSKVGNYVWSGGLQRV